MQINKQYFLLCLIIISYCYFQTKMKKNDSKFKCFKCKTVPKQFLMLACNHMVCINCKQKILQNQKNNEQFCQIICECQIKTVLLDSVKGCKSANSLKHYVGYSPVTVSSIGKNEKNDEILMNIVKSKQKTVNDFEIQVNESKLNKQIKQQFQYQIQNKQKTEVKKQISSKYFGKDLDFIDLQFKKTLDDIRNVFQNQITRLQKQYNAFRDNIKICLIQLTTLDNPNLVNINKLIKQRYQKINSQLENFHNFIFDFPHSKLNSKQNIPYILNKPTYLSYNYSQLNLTDYTSPFLSPSKNFSLYGIKKKKDPSNLNYNFVGSLISQKKNYSKKKIGFNDN